MKIGIGDKGLGKPKVGLPRRHRRIRKGEGEI